jgi:uncharacterized protein (DUF433 family)
MSLPDFLVEAPYGEVSLKGHRIGLQHVVYYYNEGYSPEMLVGQFPTLPLALVHKVIAYYLENKAETDAYIARCEEEMERQRAAGRHLDVQALRERLRALRKAETSAGS